MTTEQATRCPLCGADESKARVVRVGIRENPETEVLGCPCGLEYIRPPFDDPKAYYSLEYRKEHNPVPWAEMTAAQRYAYYRPLMEKRLPHFQRHVPPGSEVLEVGCSAGHYLDVLGQAGYSPMGCDYNPDDVAHCNEVLGIPAEVGDVGTAFPGRRFGTVCAYHVLEHVVDPVKWVETAHKRLKPGGVLYVQVPNLDDALHSLYQIPEFDQRWYREPHLTYFNADTLGRLMGSVGFEVTISYDQLYSLGNHFWWHLRREPMPDPAGAQEPMVLSPHLDSLFRRLDQEYRDTLIATGYADLLIGVGRKS